MTKYPASVRRILLSGQVVHRDAQGRSEPLHHVETGVPPPILDLAGYTQAFLHLAPVFMGEEGEGGLTVLFDDLGLNNSSSWLACSEESALTA